MVGRVCGSGRTGDENIYDWELFYRNDDDGITDVGYKLPNGVKLLLMERKELKYIEVCVNINVGYSDDPPEYPGVAHLMEHLIFHGEVGRMFARYNYRQNDNEDQDTTHSVAFTNKYTTVFRVISPTADEAGGIEKSVAKKLVTKLVDSLRNPVINEEIVVIEVEVLDTEDILRRKQESDSARLADIVCDMVEDDIGGPGNKRSLMGDTKSVKRLIGGLKAFHKKHYVGENFTVLLGGSNLEVLKLLGKEFECVPGSGGSIQERNRNMKISPEYREKIISVQKTTTKEAEGVLFIINIPGGSEWGLFGREYFSKLEKTEFVSKLNEVLENNKMESRWPVTAKFVSVWLNRTLCVVINGFCPTSGGEIKKLRNIVLYCLKKITKIEQQEKEEADYENTVHEENKSFIRRERTNWKDWCSYILICLRNQARLGDILSIEPRGNMHEAACIVKGCLEMAANTSEWITIRLERWGSYNMEERWKGINYRLNSYKDSNLTVLNRRRDRILGGGGISEGVAAVKQCSLDLVGSQEIIIGEVICRVLWGEFHFHLRKSGLVYSSSVKSVPRSEGVVVRTMLEFYAEGKASRRKEIEAAIDGFTNECPNMLRALGDDEWNEIFQYTIGLIIDGELKMPSTGKDGGAINISETELIEMKMNCCQITKGYAADVLARILQKKKS
jgi:hypothetical protein